MANGKFTVYILLTSYTGEESINACLINSVVCVPQHPDCPECWALIMPKPFNELIKYVKYMLTTSNISRYSLHYVQDHLQCSRKHMGCVASLLVLWFCCVVLCVTGNVNNTVLILHSVTHCV